MIWRFCAQGKEFSRNAGYLLLTHCHVLTYSMNENYAVIVLSYRLTLLFSFFKLIKIILELGSVQISK